MSWKSAKLREICSDAESTESFQQLKAVVIKLIVEIDDHLVKSYKL